VADKYANERLLGAASLRFLQGCGLSLVAPPKQKGPVPGTGPAIHELVAGVRFELMTFGPRVPLVLRNSNTNKVSPASS